MPSFLAGNTANFPRCPAKNFDLENVKGNWELAVKILSDKVRGEGIISLERDLTLNEIGAVCQNPLASFQFLKSHFSVPPQVSVCEIDLSNCSSYVTDEVVHSALCCFSSSLRKVSVSGNLSLTCSRLANDLALIDVLEHLDISHCIQLTDDFFLEYLHASQHHEALKTLDLSCCYDINESVAVLTFQKFRAIENLSFAGCSKLGDETLTSILITLSNLRYLDISGCIFISSSGFKKALEKATSFDLEELKAVGCLNLDDSCLLCLFNATKSLKTLHVGGLRKITDKSMEGLPNSLTDLDVSGCFYLTDKSLDRIIKCCPHIKRIQLGGCSGFGRRKLLMLRTHASNEGINLTLPSDKISGKILRITFECTLSH